jgi:hypothetical protein
MEQNPYEPPGATDDQRVKQPSLLQVCWDVWPGEQWPFWLLLLVLAVAGVVIPLIATMDLPRRGSRENSEMSRRNSHGLPYFAITLSS